MPMIERGVAPSVRRIAMSACLSVTVITSVETRLNAATATISVRMMNIRRFSTCTAANQLRLVLRPVAHERRRAEAARASSAATRGARVEVLQAQLHAGRAVDAEQLGGVVEVDQREPAVVFVVAGVEGADDGELLQARHDAGRRDLAAGQDTVTLSPLAHAERARELAAEHDAQRRPARGARASCP